MEYNKTAIIFVILLSIGQTLWAAPMRVVTSRNKTYIVSDTEVPFASITSGCSSLAGRLATLRSNAEYKNFVEALVEDKSFSAPLWFSLIKASNSTIGEWRWSNENLISSELWFHNTQPFVQEPNKKPDDCSSLDLCISASLTYREDSIALAANSHRLLDTCCSESHYFFCEDLDECACSSSDDTCANVAANCQEPTPQCLDLIGSYRCIDLLPSPTLTIDTTSTPSVGSQVILKCSVPLDGIPYKDDIPSSTASTFHWKQNGEWVAKDTHNLFTIISLSSDTEGSYECLYKLGKVKSAKSTMLDITIRPLTTPTLTAPAADVLIQEQVNLKCSTTSPGEKLYEWTLPSGTTVQTSQEIYTFQMKGWQNLGLYTCRVIVQAISSTSFSSVPFMLGLKLATPVLDIAGEKVSYALNETVELKCITSDSPTLQWLTFNWERDGQAIPDTCCNQELSFQVSSVSVEGAYSCSTMYGEKKSENSKEVELRYKWSSIPQLQTNTSILSPGVTIEITCMSIEPGNLTFEILKDDVVLSLDTVQCSTDDTSSAQQCWHLAATGLSTEGTYFCRANLGRSQSPLSFPISLITGNIKTPKITAEPSEEVKVEGGNVALICNTTENSLGLVYVFKNVKNGNVSTVAEGADQIVNISAFTTQDEGDYWCEMKHGWLQSNRSNVLHLSLVKFELLIKSSAVHILKGSRVTVTCSSTWSESAPVVLKWFQDRNQITSQEKTFIDIQDFREKNEGTYTCQAYSTMTKQWITSNDLTLTLLPAYQLCECLCTNTTVKIAVTQELIEETTSQIEEELFEPLSNLSTRKRKKTCASDNRLSSKVYGGASIFLLVAVTAFIIYIDGINLTKLRTTGQRQSFKNSIGRRLKKGSG